jgi:hypothetical protein
MPLSIGVFACSAASILLCVTNRLPGPSATDIKARSKRCAMTAKERNAFIVRHWPGLVLMIIAYALMTAIRSFLYSTLSSL